VTTPNIKVRVNRRPNLKLKVWPKLPANVSASLPLTLDRTGGSYAFGLSIDELRVSLDGVYAPIGSAPGGLNTELQYNNNGVFDGISGATTDGTKVTLVDPDLGTPSAITLTNGTGLPVSGLAAQAAYTIVVNNTNGSASPTAVNMASLTTKSAPAGSDYVMLSDQAASGALKKATIYSILNVYMFTANGMVGDGTTDDTAAFQALLDSLPSNAVLDGKGKTYKITSAVTIPAGSTYLKIQNANFTVSGDINFLSVASGVATFFEMDTVLITASGQTTLGRKCIDISRMSRLILRKVWINATSGKSYGIYGAGTGGASPYYFNIEDCYIGNISIGIFLDDAAGAALGVNSNKIENCRIQPGTGNIAVYLGAFSQNINILGCQFESVGGTGIYMDGTGHWVEGCRFESQTVGISMLTNLTNSKVGIQIWDSNATNISYASTAVRAANLVLFDPSDNKSAFFPGGIFSSHNRAGIGYATGAGGTVTQATSKATAVTLDTPTGAITTHNASLASGATVSFTQTCAAASTGKEIVDFNWSGGSVGQYVVTPINLGGAIQWSIRSINAGALAESLVIQYALVKSVNS
jgi:hypothetical protein